MIVRVGRKTLADRDVLCVNSEEEEGMEYLGERR